MVEGRFEELPRFDCMVSAANSFGLMDGGVDGAITRFFGDALMDAVQARIIANYFGEQPVGTSFIIESGHPDHPFLAHTPTMRVPMPIAGTDNVYNAMFAMLRAVVAHNRSDPRTIRAVACPGLGTATGRMDHGEAARQMRLGLHAIRFPVTEISWPVAQLRHQNVRPRR